MKVFALTFAKKDLEQTNRQILSMLFSSLIEMPILISQETNFA